MRNECFKLNISAVFYKQNEMKILFLTSMLLNLALCFSQLFTNTHNDINQLVNYYFSENSVPFNIIYTGSPQAIGSYDAINTNLGITNGIVMTTGSVIGSQGPQGPNNKDGAGMNNNYPGTELLRNIVNTDEVYNAATLEFDFIAETDTFFIDYIFGSEEYDEFVFAGFKDLVAIFISGEGIEGNKNIALLSNGNYVSIDNVNASYSSYYFISNGDGITPPYNQDPTYIQYDGYTKLLRAISPTTIGKKYHIIISIADVQDAIYDSGVFLSSNSFGYTNLAEKTKNNLNIYPNPSSDFINLKDIDLTQVEKIELIDGMGKIVENFEIKTLLNLEHVKNGNYILKITSKSTCQYIKTSVFKY
jgi:hypothetical protein